MTPNELAAHNRAYTEAASMRAVRADAQTAYYEACNEYTLAYMEMYQKHLASLETG
jgi:hypothetical protein